MRVRLVWPLRAEEELAAAAATAAVAAGPSNSTAAGDTMASRADVSKLMLRTDGEEGWSVLDLVKGGGEVGIAVEIWQSARFLSNRPDGATMRSRQDVC